MRAHILLIDDDEDELSFLSESLRAICTNCTCTFSSSGIHALGIIEHIYPDLIFIDYNMPKMNGIQCITEMRKFTNVGLVPIILYSSQIDEQLRKQAIAAGASHCLKKTSDLKSLTLSLRDLLQSRAIPTR